MKRTATALLLLWAATACTDNALGLDGQARIQETIGPDEIDSHVITAETSGAMLVELSWNNRNIDLDLYITATECQSDDPLSDCTVLAASSRILSNREATGINVAQGEQYKVWVANLDDERAASYGLDYEVTP